MKAKTSPKSLPDMVADQPSPGRDERTPGEARRYYWLWALFLAVAAIWGTPFRYDHANSGRYLLSVLHAADPHLFANDQVVAAFGRFGSLFYSSLAFVFHAGKISPQALQPVMYGLYIAYHLLLLLAVFLIARRLSRSVWLFVFLAAWAAFPEESPVGGVSLFTPQLIHTSVALVLGLFALYFLLERRSLLFWSFLAGALLVHPLVTAGLLLALGPPAVLLPGWREGLKGWVGPLLFALAIVLYLGTLAPPPLSAREAAIFLSAKGTMSHVSFLQQPWIDWVRMIGVIALSLLGYRCVLREAPEAKLLAGAVVSGAVWGLLLSLAALTSDSYRLAQFQPMRIFYWVTLFAYLLIMMAAVRALRSKPLLGPLLVGILAFSILDSLWVFVFLYLGIAAWLFSKASERSRSVGQSQRKLENAGLHARWSAKIRAIGLRAVERLTDRRVLGVGFGILLAAILAAWALGRHQPFASFRDPAPVVAAGLLGLIAWINRRARPTSWWPVTLLICFLMFAASYHFRRYYSVRTDPHWHSVQLWARSHSEKSDRFLITGGEGNFRTRSFRSSVGEPDSALAWVAPTVYEINARRARLVALGRRGGRWDLPYLACLAKRWESDFIVVKGDYGGDRGLRIAFRSGAYTVFRLNLADLTCDPVASEVGPGGSSREL